MKLLLKRVLSRFSTKLPVGATEFEKWADSIIELSGQFADRDSMIFAISSTLIHADAKHGSLPKAYFVNRLRKAAANQIASQMFQDIKLRQQAEQQKQQSTVEATPAQEQGAASDVQTT